MMSLTEVSNGIAPLDEAEARALTNRIRQCVAVALVDIEKAWRGRAWAALGYSTWDEYRTAEFGEHIRLPRDERQAAVAELRAAGMSTRAIASVTGSSKNTITKDLSHIGTPAADDDIAEAEIVERPTVTGLDGKSYTTPIRPRPVELTAEQQAAIDHEDLVRRRRKRIESFTIGWIEFRGFRSCPERDEVLAQLIDRDRELLNEAEEAFGWT